MLRDGGAVAKSVTEVEAEEEGSDGTGGASLLGRKGAKNALRRVACVERECVGGEEASTLR